MEVMLVALWLTLGDVSAQAAQAKPQPTVLFMSPLGRA